MAQTKTDIEKENDLRLNKISDLVLDVLRIITNTSVEEQVSLLENL